MSPEILESDIRWNRSGSPGGIPGVHHPTHENGGGDEVSVAGLSGVLADAQTPAAHEHAGEDITSGTVSTDLYSAIADLIEEAVIGPGADQVAWGDHEHAGTYAPAAEGVTNGNTHDHAGGDGNQIDHGGLAGLLDDDHTQYQKESEKGAASGYASLDGSQKVVENPASATATPTASKIPIADGSGTLDGWVTGEVPADGWVTAGETWTYASADDPTYTLTISGDKTSKYSARMKVRVSQATGGTKYFIITGVSYGGVTLQTTIALYGGTDYNLENEAISSPCFSTMQAPYGFPPDPTKWTVRVEDTSLRSEVNPVSGTWYNLGAVLFSVPIGVWSVSYQVYAGAQRGNVTSLAVLTTLSTANNSESDKDWTAVSYFAGAAPGAGNNIEIRGTFYRRNTLVLAAKTTYYLNTSIAGAGTLLANINNGSTLILEAVSSYL